MQLRVARAVDVPLDWPPGHSLVDVFSQFLSVPVCSCAYLTTSSEAFPDLHWRRLQRNCPHLQGRPGEWYVACHSCVQWWSTAEQAYAVLVLQSPHRSGDRAQHVRRWPDGRTWPRSAGTACLVHPQDTFSGITR